MSTWHGRRVDAGPQTSPITAQSPFPNQTIELTHMSQVLASARALMGKIGQNCNASARALQLGLTPASCQDTNGGESELTESRYLSASSDRQPSTRKGSGYDTSTEFLQQHNPDLPRLYASSPALISTQSRMPPNPTGQRPQGSTRMHFSRAPPNPRCFSLMCLLGRLMRKSKAA